MDELLKAVFQVASSPGGQAALLALFKDYNVPQSRLDVVISTLPVPAPPPLNVKE